MIQDKKLGDFMSRYLALATQSKEENRMIFNHVCIRVEDIDEAEEERDVGPAEEEVQQSGTDPPQVELVLGDLADADSMRQVLESTRPDEIYNLGAMSHVQVSFEMPEYTANVDGLGALRILEAVRALGLENKTH